MAVEGRPVPDEGQGRAFSSHTPKIGADNVLFEGFEKFSALLFGVRVPGSSKGLLAHGGYIERPGEQSAASFACFRLRAGGEETDRSLVDPLDEGADRILRVLFRRKSHRKMPAWPQHLVNAAPQAGARLLHLVGADRHARPKADQDKRTSYARWALRRGSVMKAGGETGSQ